MNSGGGGRAEASLAHAAIRRKELEVQERERQVRCAAIACAECNVMHGVSAFLPSLTRRHLVPRTPSIHPFHSQLRTAEQRIVRLESQLAEAKQVTTLYTRRKAAFDQ